MLKEIFIHVRLRLSFPMVVSEYWQWRAQKSVAVMGMLRWGRRHNREEKISSGSDISERV